MNDVIAVVFIVATVLAAFFLGGGWTTRGSDNETLRQSGRRSWKDD